MRARLSASAGRTLVMGGPVLRITFVPLSHGRHRLDIELAAAGFNTLMVTLESAEEVALLREVLGEKTKDKSRRRRPARGGTGED